MYIYQISCYSRCGSYFGSYLQSVSVIADSKEEAIKLAKKWLKREGRSFIYPEDSWSVLELGDVKKGVIDYHDDSDY